MAKKEAFHVEIAQTECYEGQALSVRITKAPPKRRVRTKYTPLKDDSTSCEISDRTCHLGTYFTNVYIPAASISDREYSGQIVVTVDKKVVRRNIVVKKAPLFTLSKSHPQWGEEFDILCTDAQPNQAFPEIQLRIGNIDFKFMGPFQANEEGEGRWRVRLPVEPQ